MSLTRTVILALVFAVCPAVLGGQVVHFEDGRSLVIASLEMDGDLALLQLEGGGTIAVPGDRISHVEAFDSAPKATVAVESARPTAARPGGRNWRHAAGKYADTIASAADKHSLSPELLTAMVQVESGFNPLAVSPKGAQGLLQLMPQTAERFGVADVFDVSQNVDAGARYISWLLDRYEGRTDLALAGYNAGESAVDQYQGIPPYAETRAYVSRVMARADNLRQGQ